MLKVEVLWFWFRRIWLRLYMHPKLAFIFDRDCAWVNPNPVRPNIKFTLDNVVR